MALDSVKMVNFIQGNQDVSNLIFKNTWYFSESVIKYINNLTQKHLIGD